MGVYIPGLEKPKCCELCPLADEGWCRLMTREQNMSTNGYEDLIRLCPLVEVPTPHGRLIDAKRLMYEAETCRETTDAFIELTERQSVAIESEE